MAQPVPPFRPDGRADELRSIASTLDEGAIELRRGSQARDTADRYLACIDANRLMMRAAERLLALS